VYERKMFRFFDERDGERPIQEVDRREERDREVER
jgi:hypothetical protein